jgi:GNAT superfamily N-acetyltransferase
LVEQEAAHKVANSAMAVAVRPAELTDAGAIATAHIASWQSGYEDLIADEVLRALGSRLLERTLRWQTIILGAETEGHFVLVGEIDGELAGFLTGGACRDDREEPLGEVHGCYVDPAHWRKGVGSALMATAIERLTQAGHSEAVLWVLAGNLRARAFYEAHGWVADGAEKTYDLEGGRYPEVRYRRNLGKLRGQGLSCEEAPAPRQEGGPH